MAIDINKCDLNNDFYHFSNKSNINSILNNGLIPTVGSASQLVGDMPNVSLSQGGKGIIGILNSFIYMFYTKVKICDIPENYKKYFLEIEDFSLENLIPKDIACKAIMRKLQDEVYFRVKVDEEELQQAKVGGLTGFDIKLPISIDSSKIDIITDSNGNILNAYDVALFIYEKVKNIEIFREMNLEFFYMFEMLENNLDVEVKFG